jgi:hypothetical protein
LIFCCAAAAQFTVEGDAVLRTTGQPLPGVRVLAHCPEAHLTATDPSGHFQFLGLPPQGCVLVADGPGLIQRSVFVTPPAAGAAAAVRVEVWPQALIAGKVLDETGWPMIATLRLCRHPDIHGLVAATTNINELGENRFGKLAPGRYYIYVVRAGSSYSGGVFTPGWYRANEADAATPIDVTVGRQLTNTDIRLWPVGGVELSGRVTMPDGFEASQANLVAYSDLILGTTAGLGRIRVAWDGSFIIRHVAPGNYYFSVTRGMSTIRRRRRRTWRRGP